MAQGAINFNIDSLDDPVLPDQIPSFDGGQFSNLRANLLQPNQSKLLQNCDIDKLGKIRTRRGTIKMGTGPPSGVADTIIQGLTSYQTAVYNYVVAANNAKLWKYTDGTPGTWTQIGTGGAADNDDITFFRLGLINNPTGYLAGTTVLTVDNVGGAAPSAGGGRVEVGEKLYFLNNIKNEYYEYTIAAVNTVAPANVTQITLEEPGLVFDVGDNWSFTVARPAQINNGGGYAGGYAGALTIDNYVGVVNVDEFFVIKSENVTHRAHVVGAGTPTTSITTFQNWNAATHAFVAGALQADWAASDAVVPIVFAQGNDLLYFCDGVGAIYGWNGKTLMNLGGQSILDIISGTGSYFTGDRTTPPTACKVLVWFQNRLIASGIASEPDAVYYSDFNNGTAWDHDYQKERIGGGESDPITGIVPWTDMLAIIFKKNSIYGVNLDPTQNPNPDDPTLLVASYGVKRLHRSIGCPAPLSAVQVGGGSSTPGSDIFFMDGDKKVHSVRRVMAAETQQEIGTAVSLPIQDVLDTTDLNHIDKAVAWYHNEHYVLAIPSAHGVGVTYPNLVVAYNLLTQSWCGQWTGWLPTCFAMRTDLGSYSKLILGESNLITGHCNVLQWLDDQSLDDETTASYQDWGNPIQTQITTRAFTGGDMYSFKTGLSVEFEFDESVAGAVTVQVILDKVPQNQLIAWSPSNPSGVFSSLSQPRLTVPFTIPTVLPGSPGLLRKGFDLQRYGTWRELQFFISTDADKLAIRSIRLTYFMDTIGLQTLPSGFAVVNAEFVTGDDGLNIIGDDSNFVSSI